MVTLSEMIILRYSSPYGFFYVQFIDGEVQKGK